MKKGYNETKSYTNDGCGVEIVYKRNPHQQYYKKIKPQSIRKVKILKASILHHTII